MTWEFWLAVLKALPAFIALMASIKATADARVNQGLGYDAAVADALSIAERDHRSANVARVDATERQAQNPISDDAFDPDFKRVD